MFLSVSLQSPYSQPKPKGGFGVPEHHLIVQVHHVGFHLRVGLVQLVNLLVELLNVFVVVQN